MSKNKNEVALKVSVNGGTPVIVVANRNAPLRTIIPKALDETATKGQPPENWDVKDLPGNVLPLDQKIEEFNFGPDVVLFLSLKVGAAGAGTH